MPHTLFTKLQNQPWVSDTLLRYCPWGNDTGLGTPVIWRTGSNPGTLEPFSTTAWSIHTGLPRNVPCRSIHTFSDGYSIFYERDETIHELHLAAIHPRAVAIHCTEVIYPEIISFSGELNEENGRSSLELEGETLSLQTKETASGCHILLTSEVTGMPMNMKPDPSLIDQDLSSLIRKRFDKREAYWSLQEDEIPEGGSLHHSVETLLYALRNTDGIFSGLWMEDGHSNRMTLNHLMAHAAALSWLDPLLSRNVILTAAGVQTPDGRVSAFSGTESATQAKSGAWPQICRASASLIEHLDDYTPLKRLVPKLHSILLSSLRVCHNKETHLYLWPTENEAFLPELYDDALATVDCAAMLLAEIEAYRSVLACSHMETEMDLSELERHQSHLEKSITTFFAHRQSATYRDRIIDGDAIKRLTLSSITPLLTSIPDPETATRLTGALTSPDQLLAENGIRDWEPWEDDDEPPAVNLSRQLQFLPLDTSIRSVPAELLTLWRSVSQTVMETAASSVEHVNALAALHVHATNLILQPGKEKEPPKWLAWMEKNRKWVLPIPITLFLVLVIGITTAYQTRKAPPRNTIQALIGLAQHHYQMDEQAEALELLDDLYDSGVKTPAIINLIAKSNFRAGNYERAQEFFERMNRQQPNPGTELNIALSVYQQGRLEDAEALYKDLSEKYRSIQPQISERADLCIELMNEGNPSSTLMMEENQQLGM